MVYTDDVGLHPAVVSCCQLLLDAKAAIIFAVGLAVGARSVNFLPDCILYTSKHQLQLAHYPAEPITASPVALAQMVVSAFCSDMYLLEHCHADTHRKSFGG